MLNARGRSFALPAFSAALMFAGALVGSVAVATAAVPDEVKDAAGAEKLAKQSGKSITIGAETTAGSIPSRFARSGIVPPTVAAHPQMSTSVMPTVTAMSALANSVPTARPTTATSDTSSSTRLRVAAPFVGGAA